MTFRTLIRRSLRFHWRSHLGVVIGAAIGSAALTGALVVGDSVKGSLREKALARLGNIDAALMPTGRLFSEDLADRLFRTAPLESGAAYAPVLILPASVANQDGSTRANSIQLVGVDERFTAFGGDRWKEKIEPDTAHLNQALAKQLGVEEGQYVLVRARKPSGLSMEVPAAPRSGASLALRLRVDSIVPDDSLGSLALEGTGLTPMNLFVRLEDLQRQAKAIGNANRILARSAPVDGRVAYSHGTNASHSFLKLGRSPDLHAAATHSRSLTRAWRLSDTQSEVTRVDGQHLEVRSDRIFLDPPIERATLETVTNARPVLTYIANLLLSGTNNTPYSMVTAAGPPWTPAGMKDDEIVLTQWLANDLRAGPGDAVTLVYYDPESGGQLTEHTNVFRVHSVVPMELPWADRTLMPDFPGIEDAETTADWDTAFPLTYTIRSKDDEYWQEYRGTPKAFITLAAGQEMWGNRFGEVTAVRFPAPTKEVAGARSTVSQTTENGDAVKRGPAVEDCREALERKILANLDPAELGLSFEPVREQALKAAQGSQDFGGLFIGFSMFLIAAALILMALLFQFGLEQRSAEVGTLLALGFTHKQVRRLLLGEGAALAFIGGVIGVLGGVFYAKAMLLGLTTVWRDAVGATTLKFFVTPDSLAIGLLASTLVAVFTIWLALRKQAKRPAIALLTSEMGDGRRESGSHACEGADGRGSRTRRIFRVFTNATTVGCAALVVGVGLVGWALAAGATTNAGVFFGAGTLVLIGALALMSARLQRRGGVLPAHQRTKQQGRNRGGRATFSTAALTLRGLARRRSRSVATAALLACGSFLILSIGVFRLDANRDAAELTSGTGGFALIGESTIPIVQDLNSASGREFFALEEQEVEGAGFVQFRVRAGDDASCLNLNRAQQPRLMGVQPEALEDRFTFAKIAGGLEASQGWRLLKSEIEAVPAIGDLNSILWAMGRKVGDTIDYVDDRGRPFKVRIVGGVANSILQGTLIIDEAAFVQRFPGESGYEYFLMDAPTNRVEELSGLMSRTLQDYGMEVTPAARRLNQFNAVQNTYLGTFQVLGGLGLLLGSAGLGIVVLRNVLERRGELALLLAVGFRRNSVERMVLMEHAGLLGLGLAIGLIAAVVAVLPTLISPAAQLPYATLLPTLVAVLANGLLWTWAATRLAMRGNLLEALRNE